MNAPASGAWLLAAAGLFGWVWGSFLNTVVDRTPRRDGSGPKVGWLSPARSICLGCGVSIPWYDNLPVISYAVLRGRCRSCGAAIGMRTLVVEVVTPLVFIVLAWLVPFHLQRLWWLWWAGVASVGIILVPLSSERRRTGWAIGGALALLAVAAATPALALLHSR